MIREPSSPSGTRAVAIANTTAGPSDQASCAVPTWRARLACGACSAMYVQATGTPAPTAMPVRITPSTSIHAWAAKTTNRVPTM